MGEISIVDFASYVNAAVATYPNARVVSIGVGTENKEWCFFVWIRDNEGREVSITIPCKS